MLEYTADQLRNEMQRVNEAIQDIEENGYRYFQLKPGGDKIEHTDIMLKHYKRDLKRYNQMLNDEQYIK